MGEKVKGIFARDRIFFRLEPACLTHAEPRAGGKPQAQAPLLPDRVNPSLRVQTRWEKLERCRLGRDAVGPGSHSPVAGRLGWFATLGPEAGPGGQASAVTMVAAPLDRSGCGLCRNSADMSETPDCNTVRGRSALPGLALDC